MASPRLIDCFIFYNESEMLDFRLEYLKSHVDAFVCVEATETFTGRKKDTAGRRELEKFIHHLISFPNDLQHIRDGYWPTDNDCWMKERHQRNQISKPLESLGLSDNDIILVHDVDEIPDRDTLASLRDQDFDLCCLGKDVYFYNVQYRHPKKCRVGKAVRYGFLREVVKEVNMLRWWHGHSWHIKGHYIVNDRGGWHLSYFGDVGFISNKIRNYSHQEHNTPAKTSHEEILKSIRAGIFVCNPGAMRLEFVRSSVNPYLPEGWERWRGFFMPDYAIMS